MAKGKLVTVTAPSGAGKTTLVSALVKNDDSLSVSVSHTTRPKRPNETDGVNYHFIEEAEFLDMLQDGDFLESAEVYGHRYGTSQSWVNEQLNEGKNIILEIDWQGAAQVRNLYPDTCSIFILPPSLEELTARLHERAQDDEDTIEDRMKEARGVIEHVCEAEYVVVNDEFERALEDMRAIVRAIGLQTVIQQDNQARLLTSLTRG